MEIKPNHKAIKAYYQALEDYQQQGFDHEMAVRQAFANLLETIAKPLQWTLILEYSLPNRKRIDGALRDSFRIPRGYWEAKDTSDDLESDMKKKIAIGYPCINTIFEDTRHGVLYQNDQRVTKVDLTDPTELAKMLTLFLGHAQPQIAEFHTAVTKFQERIPELATALLEHINKEEQENNQGFVTAFESFYTLCKKTLNPNLSRDAVKEMLVQHLLTERLFRTIFNNSDFVNRNVIAAEIEKVIYALTSHAFSREEFLKQLDYFYLTIEQTAATITDFAEKQEFLNTVYERFFQGFSHKQADTYGIVYTPQEIVDFMCASVDVVLQREFGASLSSKDVSILDPCVGTGNFMVNILRRISGMTLRYKYEQELFCNEVMLLPYYIASLNIEHAYYELAGNYLPFDGMCFVDTLDLADAQQTDFFTDKNTERIERQKDANIMVIIGNPPYNVGQLNENDNNKNREYQAVDKSIRDTYVKDSKATLNTKLYDMYVRFFRWAIDRLEGRDGIICFVSNNGFLEGIAFDGFRKHVALDFTHIYHLDLGGNARRSGGGNVFDIRVGVGITVLVRKGNSDGCVIHYHKVTEDWRKEQKLAFLADIGDIHHVPWKIVSPDANHIWLTQSLHAEFADFIPMGTKEAKAKHTDDAHALFNLYSLGIATNRDNLVYSFQATDIASRAQTFIEIYNITVDRLKRSKEGTDPLSLIDTTDVRIKWTRQVKNVLSKHVYSTFEQDHIRHALYRPFTRQFVYFDDFWNEERYKQYTIFPTLASETENVAICVTDKGSEKPFMTLVINAIPDLHLVSPGCGTQTFPFYTYDKDGSNRQENITDWALEQFQAHYGAHLRQAQLPTKWDIFYYTYAVLHHPEYRKRYAKNLYRELPRIPMLGDSATLHTLVDIGKRLAELHLHYEEAKEYPLQPIQNRDVPWTWRVEKMKLTKDKTAIVVNEALTLSGIPAHCFDYQLGNRSALEWVIDQYQVKTDKRSGMVSDPNRHDDPEYIVRLIGRIVTVSVETIKLIEHLAHVSLGEDA